METSQLLPPQAEPLITECAQLVGAWIDVHIWALAIIGVLAVIGGLGLVEYAMRVGAGLAERVYDYYKQKRGEV